MDQSGATARFRTSARGSVLRAAVLLTACALMAAACTKAPPGGEQAIGFESGQPGPVTEGSTTVPGDSAVGEDFFGETEVGDGDVGGAAPLEGVGEASQPAGGAEERPAGAAGAAAPQAPTSAQAGSPGPGVDGQKVKIVFHGPVEPCGSSFDTFTDKDYLVMEEYVGWYNDEVLGPHGWQLEYEVVDDGGPECPEKAQAAALKIAREIKPFAVLGSTVTKARGPVLQDAVTRAGIVHMGINFDTYESISAREPYARPSRGVAETALRDLLGWIDVRVKGTQVANRTSGLPEDRVYGILGVETPDGRRLAKIAHERIRAMGITPAGVYEVSGDDGVAAQQGTNLALRMRQDGVNTVVWALPYSSILASVAMTEAMNSQNYLPDILVGTMGLAFFDQLHNSRVWANARGTSQLPVLLARTAITADNQEDPDFKDMVENADAYIRVWHRLGHNDNPQDGAGASDIFQDLAQLATGILHLPGPVLNAETLSQGLESARRGQPNRCTVARFMGRDYEYTLTWDWATKPPYGPKGFTTVYWVNKVTPPFASGLYESYDNYRFFESPADLPPEPSRDTGSQGYDIPKQKFIGLFPWSDCGQWPNYR